MEEFISDIADRVEENSTKRPSDYYDEDGLLRCGICKMRKENRYNFMGRERVVSCLCKCDQAIMEARKEEEAKMEFARRVQSLKTIGLTYSAVPLFFRDFSPFLFIQSYFQSVDAGAEFLIIHWL